MSTWRTDVTENLGERLRSDRIEPMKAARPTLVAETLAPMMPEEIGAEIETYGSEQRREEQAVVKVVLESMIIKCQTRRWDKTRAAVAPAAKVATKAAPAKRVPHAGGHR